jgi:hypothetical protein
LVAATTLGLSSLASFQADVSFDEPGDDHDGELRLVVQSYAAGSVAGGAPSRGTRPLGSIQRSVTREELRQGIPVRLVQLGEDSGAADIVAWVERGAPDLEFDARMARPGHGAAVGWASARGGRPHVQLRRSS